MEDLISPLYLMRAYIYYDQIGMLFREGLIKHSILINFPKPWLRIGACAYMRGRVCFYSVLIHPPFSRRYWGIYTSMVQRRHGVMAVLEFLLSLVLVLASANSDVVKQQLQIVILLPSTSEDTAALSAAQYATDTINQDSSILPDYHLELTEVDSGGCGVPEDEYRPLVEFISSLAISAMNETVIMAGVLGPYCGQYPVKTGDLLFSTLERFNISHISGSPRQSVRTDNASPVTLAPRDDALLSIVLHVVEHFGWQRIALIGGTDPLYSQRNNFLMELTSTPQSSIEIVSSLSVSSEFSVPSVLQQLQENDVTIILLSMRIDQVYQVLCQVYKYHHLMWPEYVWIVYGHWFDDVVSEARLSSQCSLSDILNALEGVLFLNVHFEPEDKSSVIVSGQTYEDYITRLNVISPELINSTTPEIFRANLAYDSVWALALALDRTKQPNSTALNRDELLSVDFNGSSGRVNLNTSQLTMRVDIAQVSEGTLSTVGVSDNRSVRVNQSVLDSAPLDSLPRTEVVPLWVIALFVVVSSVIEVFTLVLLVLYLYFRKEPEIKATSPYLSLLAFAGVFLVFFGVEMYVLALSGQDEYVSTPLCVSVIWFLTHGDAFFLITLLVKLVRIYRIFNYFGKTGKKWSDTVLFAVVFGLVLVITVNSTLWSVFSSPVAVTRERVVDGQVLVQTTCEFDLNAVWGYIFISYVTVLRLILVVLAIMTRNIPRENFKDTKKINIFIFLSIPLEPLFFFQVILVDLTLKIVVSYVNSIGLAILYVALLIIPKVWPPFLRKIYTLVHIESH